MSERCSFTSQYIYDKKDYETLKKLFQARKDKLICTAPPSCWGGLEMPIIQGKTIGWGKGDEYEILMDFLSGVKTEEAVRFTIMCDSESLRLVILEKSPDGEVSFRYIEEEDLINE